MYESPPRGVFETSRLGSTCVPSSVPTTTQIYVVRWEGKLLFFSSSSSMRRAADCGAHDDPWILLRARTSLWSQSPSSSWPSFASKLRPKSDEGARPEARIPSPWPPCTLERTRKNTSFDGNRTSGAACVVIRIRGEEDDSGEWFSGNAFTFVTCGYQRRGLKLIWEPQTDSTATQLHHLCAIQLVCRGPLWHT